MQAVCVQTADCFIFLEHNLRNCPRTECLLGERHRFLVSAERRWRSEDARWQSSARYGGARPASDWNTNPASLIETLCDNALHKLTLTYRPIIVNRNSVAVERVHQASSFLSLNIWQLNCKWGAVKECQRALGQNVTRVQCPDKSIPVSPTILAKTNFW